jgi:hypothetical protein
MHSNSLKYYILLPLLFLATVLFGQDPGDINSLIQEEVVIWNPVYKPVIGLGVGSFNFFGDVQTPNQGTFNGDPGFKVNVSTFIDNKHNFRGNFFFMVGNLSGNERSYNDTIGNGNLNFKSNIYTFGVNVNYDFDHFIAPTRRLRPFISLGFEIITFDTKTDLSANIEGVDIPYNYWNDGSIRDASYSDNPNADLIRRDYIYETDVKTLDYGLENYPQYALAIPFDIGLDYQVTDRVMFRIGTSLHYTFSDEIDHISSKNTREGFIGDNMKDMFTYSYFTIHLDLFSSDKTITVEKLFAEVDFDYTLMGDEDSDGIFDGIDRCPGTTYGVDIDTAGCPIDSDFDLVPNYLDDEPNSRYGAYVDERGVEMSEDDVIASLDMSKAVARVDISKYIRTPSSYSNYKKQSSKEIPQKFVKVDVDADGYISYDEMMRAIDGFFDFDSELSSDDIYELNDFFFTQ